MEEQLDELRAETSFNALTLALVIGNEIQHNLCD